MKAASNAHRPANDFYLSTLAPVRRHKAIRFTMADALLLGVLFLETVVVMRFLIAT